MKHLVRNALVVALGLGIVGCEWQGGSDDNSWSDAGSVANFNGSYRGNGGYLVSEYTIQAAGDTASSTNATDGVYTSYTGENGGNTGANLVHYTGQAQHGSIKPGSFVIVIGGVSGSAHDDGSGTLQGSYVIGVTNRAVSGHIEYGTGVWTMQLTSPGLPPNLSISLNYQATAASSGATSSGPSAGSSGVSIYVFNVQQDGSRLKFIDNNGSIYNGSMGEIKTSGNLGAGAQGATPVNGDQLVGQFHAAGKSAAGIYVNMTGVFQGTIQGVTVYTEKSGSSIVRKTSYALADRRIQGTWIEDGGKTGDINGLAQSSVNVTSFTVVSNTTASITGNL